MMLKQNWKNAIIHYEKATVAFPEKFTAHHKLALAHSYNCKNNNLDCKKTEILVEKLLKKFPEAKGKLGTVFYNIETH